MMKKNIYEAPTMQVINMQTTHFLAASGDLVNVEKENTEYTGEFYGREFDFDDDMESEWLIDFGV